MDEIKQKSSNNMELHSPRTSITELPPEILTSILQYCTLGLILQPSSSFVNIYRESRERCLLPLVHTCRRWRQLFEPFQYERLCLDFETKARCNIQMRLLSTLETRPYLFSYVRKVHIRFPEFYGKECSEISPKILWVVESLTNSLEELHLSNKVPKDHAQIIYRAVTSLPICKLYVDSRSAEMLFNCTVQPNPNSTIQHMHLSRYSHIPHQVVEPDSLNNADSKSADGSGWLCNLKSLVIEMTSLAADDLDLILQYPKALDFLSLRKPGADGNTSTYGTRIIQNLVDRQCKSLKSIELDLYGTIAFFEQTEIPDFALCSSLEVLRLSDFNLLLYDPETTCHKLGTLSLKRLSIVISKHWQNVAYSHSDYLRQQVWKQQAWWRPDFGEERMKWLVEFATLSKHHYPDSRLQKIHIEYEWNSDIIWEAPEAHNGVPYDPPWPNAYLAISKPLIEALEIELTWSTPYVEEEEWESYVKGVMSDPRSQRYLLAYSDPYNQWAADRYMGYEDDYEYEYETWSIISMADESEKMSDSEETDERSDSEDESDGSET